MPCALRLSFRPGLSLTKSYRGGPARPASDVGIGPSCARGSLAITEDLRDNLHTSGPAIPLGGVTQQQHHRAYTIVLGCPAPRYRLEHPAAKYRLPANPPITFDQTARGLRAGLHRHGSTQCCAKPSDLPVEITILVRTVVDLAAVNARGSTAPVTLLARAVDKIE